MRKVYSCPNCGCTELMRYRHDSDWSSQVQYTRVNEDRAYVTGKTYPVPEVEVYHCPNCEYVFDTYMTLTPGKAISEHILQQKIFDLRKAAIQSEDPASMKAVEILEKLAAEDIVTLPVFSQQWGISPGVITTFRGSHAFLSNFYKCPIRIDGNLYMSAEAAFQAAKAYNPHDRELFVGDVNPSYAKKLGRQIQLRSDWDQIKLKVMYNIVYQKFLQNKDLQQELLKTNNAVIQEVNSWGDIFWGMDDQGNGENHLGRILMMVRSHFRSCAKL